MYTDTQRVFVCHSFSIFVFALFCLIYVWITWRNNVYFSWRFSTFCECAFLYMPASICLFVSVWNTAKTSSRRMYMRLSVKSELIWATLMLPYKQIAHMCVWKSNNNNGKKSSFLVVFPYLPLLLYFVHFFFGRLDMTFDRSSLPISILPKPCLCINDMVFGNYLMRCAVYILHQRTHTSSWWNRWS